MIMISDRKNLNLKILSTTRAPRSPPTQQGEKVLYLNVWQLFSDDHVANHNYTRCEIPGAAKNTRTKRYDTTDFNIGEEAKYPNNPSRLA